MKILLSAYTGLGNMVLKTPMIRQLKILYPHAQLDLIAGNAFGTEYLLKNSPLIGKTHILKERASLWNKWKFFRLLRKEKYDIILLPFDASHRFLMLGSYVAGIKKRVRHIETVGENWHRSWSFFRKLWSYPKTIFVPILADRHEIDLNYDLLAAIYQRPFERNYDTFVEYEKNQTILQKYNLLSDNYFVIQAGGANGLFPVKLWPPTNFIRLIQKLLETYDYPIVLVGDSGDYEAVIRQICVVFAAEKRVINTAGQTSLNDLMNLLNNASLIIAHDSGVMHFADALSKKLISLYGPTDYTRTRPLKSSSQVIFSKTPYFAAMYQFATTEAELTKQGIGHQAMKGVSVNLVMEKINYLLYF